MNTIEGTTIKTGAELAIGDFIRDDIMCKIISVTEPNYDETAVMVEDGNGFTYMIRIGMFAEYRTYNWTEQDWEAYKAL